MTYQQPDYLGYYPGAELVFAIVCPLGTPYNRVVEALGNYLSHFGYRTEKIQVSEYFNDLLLRLGSDLKPLGPDPMSLAQHKISAGNTIRQLAAKHDVMALVASASIADFRYQQNQALGRKAKDRRSLPLNNTAYVISTVRRPEEVTTLRRIYGEGFFLIGANASREVRERYLLEKGIARDAAASLMDTDAKQKADYGQATREAFQMADVFLSGDGSGDAYAGQVSRFLDLIFGCPSLTTTLEEERCSWRMRLLSVLGICHAR